MWHYPQIAQAQFREVLGLTWDDPGNNWQGCFWTTNLGGSESHALSTYPRILISQWASGPRSSLYLSLPWCLFENFPSLVLLYPLLAMWLSENLNSQHSNHTHVNLHNVWFQKLALSQTRINSLNYLSHKITSQQALKKKEKERVLRKEKATQHPVKWDFQPLQTPWNATWHSFTWTVKLSTKKGESQVPEKQAELEVAGASAWAANEGSGYLGAEVLTPQDSRGEDLGLHQTGNWKRHPLT